MEKVIKKEWKSFFLNPYYLYYKLVHLGLFLQTEWPNLFYLLQITFTSCEV